MKASLFKQDKPTLFAVITLIIIFGLCSIIYLVPYFSERVNIQNLNEQLCSPNIHHLFGTDELGRDIFLRIFYGGFISIFIGITINFISAFMGTFLGLIAGVKGGKLKSVIITLNDTLLSIPYILFTALFMMSFSKNIFTIIISMGLCYVPIFTRLVYFKVKNSLSLNFIIGAYAMGASHSYIIRKHLLPLCSKLIITHFISGIGSAILGIAALSFIGFGLNPPTAEWGSMLIQSQDYISHAPYMLIFPAFFMVVTIYCLDFIATKTAQKMEDEND